MEEGLGRTTEGTWVGGGGFREGYRENMGWWRRVQGGLQKEHGLVEEGLGRTTEGTWVGGGGFREGYRGNMGWWRRV